MLCVKYDVWGGRGRGYGCGRVGVIQCSGSETMRSWKMIKKQAVSHIVGSFTFAGLFLGA